MFTYTVKKSNCLSCLPYYPFHPKCQPYSLSVFLKFIPLISILQSFTSPRLLLFTPLVICLVTTTNEFLTCSFHLFVGQWILLYCNQTAIPFLTFLLSLEIFFLIADLYSLTLEFLIQSLVVLTTNFVSLFLYFLYLTAFSTIMRYQQAHMNDGLPFTHPNSSCNVWCTQTRALNPQSSPTNYTMVSLLCFIFPGSVHR